jgi:DNA replication protein DnaC
MIYACQVCQDSGWIYPRKSDGLPNYSHMIRCACRRDADAHEQQSRLLKFCDLPPATEDRTLERFQTCNNTDLTEALADVWDIVTGKLTFLTLAGGVDLGKTHLAVGACREWLKQGKSAKYAFVPLLLDDLRAGFKVEGDHSFDSRFNFYQKVGLLVLDDLGAEKRSEWGIEKLETIVDYRYFNELPTIITTNCEINELTDRIRSRIQRAMKSKIIAIDAPEYRTVKASRKC